MKETRIEQQRIGQQIYDFDTSDEISPADLSATDALLSKQGAVSDKARLNMSMAELLFHVNAAQLPPLKQAVSG